MNATLDGVIEIGRRTMVFPAHIAFVRLVFQKLPLNSLLIKFLIDAWVFFRPTEWTKADTIDKTAYPQNFWIIVMEGLINDPGQNDPNRDRPWDVNPCRYHVHKEKHKRSKNA